MGGEVNKSIGAEAGTETGNGGSRENKSTAPPGAGRKPRRITSSTAGTAGSAGTTGTDAKTEPKGDFKQNLLNDKSEVASVPETEQKQKKPKRVRTAKKKQSKIDTTNIDKLVVGISETIASRPNCSHWKLSEKEVKTITDPLTALLSEKEIIQKIEEHSSEIALVTACFAVFAPRIFVSYQLSNMKKQELKKVNERRKAKQAENNNIKTSGKVAQALYTPNREIGILTQA